MALGKAYESLKDTRKAIEIYSSIEPPEDDSESDPALFVTLATLHEDMEEYEKAIQYYRKCLGNEECVSRVYAAMANCYGDLNDLPGAIQVFRDAIERFPKEEKYHYNLGMLLHATGDLEGARKSLEMALQLDPDSDVTRDALADLNPNP